MITKIPYYYRGLYYFSKSSISEKYIGHRGLSVSLFVCKFVCLSVFKRSTGRTACPMVLIFLAEDVFRTRDNAELFFWQSDEGQGQGHHFCEKQIMGHNFLTGSGRDFWLVA